jgi:NADH dehydrogenase
VKIPGDRWVLVTGATGFIGSATVLALLEHGYRVRALARRVSVDALPWGERCRPALADIRTPEAVRAAMDGVQVVIHLAARKADEPDSEAVNVGGARNLVGACASRGVQRVINVSTQATMSIRRGLYGETKARADQVFATSGLSVTTLVPSLVYGADPDGVFARMVASIRRLPVIPVIGNGRTVFQPIHVSDMARTILACIENDAAINRVYEVAGPDAVTFDELIDLVARHVGLRKPKIHIPWRAGMLAALICARCLARPPITVSNVLGLAPSNVRRLDIRPLVDELGVVPISLDEGLAQVLGPAGGAPR